MQLVATINNIFFRGQSIAENEIELVKQSMLQDQEGLKFQTMTDEEFDIWLTTQ